MSSRAAEPLAETLTHPLALVLLLPVGLGLALALAAWWWERRRPA